MDRRTRQHYKALMDKRLLMASLKYRSLRSLTDDYPLLRPEEDSLWESAFPKPRDPIEYVDYFLTNLSLATEEPFAPYQYSLGHDYTLACANDAVGLNRIAEASLAAGYISKPLNRPAWAITTQGYLHLRSLRGGTKENRSRAFVAMSFSPHLRDAFTQGIRPALENCGYQAHRLDFVEHNERIDDRILGDIRHSAMLIAELTEQKAGVYFEAGFALGLGIPVIWLVHEADLPKVHFDTRQFNYIVWKDHQELALRLENRVRATHPILR